MPIDATALQVRMAIERTLLAWIRSGIAVMAFGFAVARYEAPKLDAALIGGALILLGAIAVALAGREYGRLFQRFAPDPDPTANANANPRPYSVPLARVIAVLGVGLAGWLLVRSALESRSALPTTPVRPPAHAAA